MITHLVLAPFRRPAFVWYLGASIAASALIADLIWTCALVFYGEWLWEYTAFTLIRFAVAAGWGLYFLGRARTARYTPRARRRRDRPVRPPEHPRNSLS